MQLTVSCLLENFYERYYRPAKHAGDPKRPTCVAYRSHIHALNRYFQKVLRDAGEAARVVELGDLRDELIIGCMDWDVSRGLSAETANGRRRHVNAIWTFAARKQELKGVIPRPDNERYRVLLKEPVALTMQEFEQLLATIATLPGLLPSKHGKVARADWWELCVRMFYNAGTRRSAMMQIPTRNYDADRGEILVPAAVQKHKRDQWVKLFPLTIEALRRVRPVERKVPFLLADWPYNLRTLNEHWKRLLVASGRFETVGDVPRTFGLHVIRKTFATHVAAKHGINMACELLQHSSVTVTQRYIDRRQLDTPAVPDLIADPQPAAVARPRLGVYREETA